MRQTVAPDQSEGGVIVGERVAADQPDRHRHDDGDDRIEREPTQLEPPVPPACPRDRAR